MKVYQILAPKLAEKKIKAESPMEAAKKVAHLKHSSGSSLKEFKVELSRKNKTHVYNIKLTVTKEGIKVKAVKILQNQSGGGKCLSKMLCKKQPYLQARAQSVEEIVENHKSTMKPVIVNPESNFVVVTYWWGKGNLNRNTSKPCPEDLGPNEQPTKKPIRYEVMINEWIDMCQKVKCNYLVEEFPEFAQPGMYQHAINAKPLFIKAALDACKKDKPKFSTSDQQTGKYKLKNTEGQTTTELVDNIRPSTYTETPDNQPYKHFKHDYSGKQIELDVKQEENLDKTRAVLYIDGDMLINTYPALFDIENVDFMARGWNSDPRSADNYLDIDYICYDQYIFETSGGTMYFGNTKGAREILDLWHLTSSKPINKGKADDRILSLLFNAYAMYVQYNVIELPIEYLWLTDIYGKNETGNQIVPGHVEHRHYDQIIIEHPACLTGEERAADQGASSNRQPKFYTELIDNQIVCNRIFGKWYEEIFFQDVPEGKRQDAIKSYAKYIDYLSTEALVEEVEENKDGEEERVDEYFVIENATLPENTKTLLQNIDVIDGKDEIKFVYKSNEVNANQEIIDIIQHLSNGYDVIYIPEKTDDCDHSMDILVQALIGASANSELVGFNIAKPSSNNMELYKPFLSRKCPLYFSHSSRVLRMLLALCSEIYYSSFQTRKTSFNMVFRSSHIFISRIRCKWLDPNDYDLKKLMKARALKSFPIYVDPEEFLEDH
jgi:hypothetical protein